MDMLERNKNLRLGKLLRDELWRELIRIATEHARAEDFHHRARLAKEYDAVFAMLTEGVEPDDEVGQVVALWDAAKGAKQMIIRAIRWLAFGSALLWCMALAWLLTRGL